MHPFPHRYTVTLANRRLTAAAQTPIDLGPPPQFGGSDTVWSPEELLVGAVLECLWTTFEAYARRDKLAVTSWSGTGTAILDRGPGVPVFTSIELAVELGVSAGDEELARRVLATAEKQCIISNALKVPISVRANIGAAKLAS